MRRRIEKRLMQRSSPPIEQAIPNRMRGEGSGTAVVRRYANENPSSIVQEFPDGTKVRAWVIPKSLLAVSQPHWDSEP